MMVKSWYGLTVEQREGYFIDWGYIEKFMDWQISREHAEQHVHELALRTDMFNQYGIEGLWDKIKAEPKPKNNKTKKIINK